MDLEEYLWRKEISIRKFAEKIDTCYANIFYIVKKRTSPTISTAVKILENTEGMVELTELLSEKHCKLLGKKFIKSRHFID